MTVDPSVNALRVGDELSVDIEVTNGTAQAETITLTLGVPDDLAFVSSVPAGTSTPAGPPPLSESLGIPLGSVASGSSATAEVVLEAVEAGPPAAQFTVQADDGAQIVAATNFVVDVLASDAELPGALSLRANPPSTMLAEVGDRIEYGLVVSNESTEVLEDVTIVERVAPEVHVLAAPLVAGVDAVQVGHFLAKEDIVWVIDELDAGEEVELPWAARVQAAGDLAVVSNARAKARRTDAVSASAEHFLASPDAPTQENNPPFTPIVRRVAITAPAGAPGTLPVTGLAGLWMAVGLIAILVGFTLWRFGSPLARGKRVPGTLLLLCLMTAACVSSPSDEPNASGTPEVKGRRIERGNNNDDENGTEEQAPNDDANDNGAGDGNDATDDTASDDQDETDADDDGDTDLDPNDELATADEDDVVVPPASPQDETVTFVTRELTMSELPIAAATSSTGTSGRFEWDETSRSMLAASSSIPGPGWDDEPLPIVTTSIPSGGDTIVAKVRIENPFTDRRFHVAGKLVHEVSGGGTATQLLSDPIDVVLAPEGSTVATFEYLAPSGVYDFTGSFIAG